MSSKHKPVMLNEVLSFLDLGPGGHFIDCTLGGGGYTLAIAKRIGETGKIISIDLDPSAIERVKDRVGNKYPNIIIVHENFKNLSKIVNDHWPPQKEKLFSGIVFDLGLSSDQLEDKDRGFSFRLDAPLNMRFDGISRDDKDGADDYADAYSLVNYENENGLKIIFARFGEERFAGRIARAIIKARLSKPVSSSGQLSEIINNAVPARFKQANINPATKVFQALRIAVNREMENLAEALPQAINLLKAGGRLAVISYHSLEDRIVKNVFKQESKDCLCPPEIPVCRCGHQASIKILTKKVVRPGGEEIVLNHRARSAKLRVAEKFY